MSSDLAARVETAFGRVAERMAGLPVCNPRLAVEVVGLRPWQGLYLGVLLTPWTISLLLLPGVESLRRRGADERERRRFPSGEYDFMGGRDEVLGDYHSCSLISPPAEFACQDEARAAARAILDALLEAADNTALENEAARLSGCSIACQPLSRRGFLTGGLFSHSGRSSDA